MLADVKYESGIAELPLLENYSALFQCEVRSQYTGGNHFILVGREWLTRFDPGHHNRFG